MDEFKRRLADIKIYGLPTLLLVTVALLKLHMVGALEIIYYLIKDTPIYMDNTTLEWWQIFIILMLDMVVAMGYVWVRNINRSEDTEDETNTEEEHFLDDGLKRGFNYIWMSGLSSILITVMWSVVVLVIAEIFKGAMINHPNTMLMLYVLLGGLQVVITGVIKRGILAYTVFSTYSISNILQAFKFSFTRGFKIIGYDIIYYTWALFGILLAVIGVFVTVPSALHIKSERWDKLVREFERDSLYGYLK